ncbi:uncharacterized protein LOC110102280 [Dendrobium catenatum]|uniref:Putative methyltransferase PMT21 n=1 Tax=Dendrobium catenatum TaxID=906689 RepID=A0A2I0XEQ6_9ASPA|nr:uncharacterized protein LOC110102280 [Dendrobium catenatum]PKU86379.1 putative methyltransferase PMT21 [Dendrobium catenatum]
MRNLNQFTRFGFKNGVFSFIFLLSILTLFLSITTLCIFYPQNPLSFSNSFGDQTTGQGGSIQLLDSIIEKLVDHMRAVENSTISSGEHSELNDMRLKHTAFLAEILGLAGSLKLSLTREKEDFHQQQRTPSTDTHPLSRSNGSLDETAEFFLTEEIRKYMKIKPNRLGKQNFMGANGTFMSIGHACFSLKEELEEYMDYDVGDFCKDDWKQAQRLMVLGCDPLPRRRCFARAPKLYSKPLPINESIWNLPDDRNVRWSGYRCKNFACLAANRTGKGFFKCSDCFNLTHHERLRWMQLNTSDFLIEEVLSIKQGEIRIGLDFSVGTGTFAARMKEFDVTVISATINLGAPFSEMIALRGFVPLYLTINQRLPFFDNTLDLIHSTRFLDGWIDFILLDFVLYDWDRVLRPGGLLWIDSFFCKNKDLEDYLDAFRMLRYKKHRWVVVPKLDKDGEEVFFSALLEKPPRPF